MYCTQPPHSHFFFFSLFFLAFRLIDVTYSFGLLNLIFPLRESALLGLLRRPGRGDHARSHAAGSGTACTAAGSGVAAAAAAVAAAGVAAAGGRGARLAHVAVVEVAIVDAIAIGVPYIHARDSVKVPVTAAAAAVVVADHGLASHGRRVRMRLGEENGLGGQALLAGCCGPFGRSLRAVRRLQVGALLYQHAVRHHVGLYLRSRKRS